MVHAATAAGCFTSPALGFTSLYERGLVCGYAQVSFDSSESKLCTHLQITIF
jgi:hypothetical protein